MPTPHDTYDPEDDGDWEDETELPDEPVPSIPFRAEASDPYSQTPGTSHYNMNDVADALPLFASAPRDCKLMIAIQDSDGNWREQGSMPGTASRDAIVRKVGKSGRYRIVGIGPDGRQVQGASTTFWVDADHFILRDLRHAESAGLPPGTPYVMGGGGTRLEEVIPILGQVLGPARDDLRRAQEALDRREAAIRELEAKIDEQKLLAAETLSERGFDLQRQMVEQGQSAMSSHMSQAMQFMQLQAAQAQKDADRRAEEDRRRHEQQMERLKLEADLERERAKAEIERIRVQAAEDRERERQRLADERLSLREQAAEKARDEAERAARREAYDREIREARERREAEDEARRMEREERERREAREERRWREAREAKLLEVQQRASPIGGAQELVGGIASMLGAFGLEPAALIGKLTEGAQSSGMQDLVKEGLGVLREGIKAGALRGVGQAVDLDEDDPVVTVQEQGADGQIRTVRMRQSEYGARLARQQAAQAQIAQAQQTQPAQAQLPQYPDAAQPAAPVAAPASASQGPPSLAPVGEHFIKAQPLPGGSAQADAPPVREVPPPPELTEEQRRAIRECRQAVNRFVADMQAQPEEAWAQHLTTFLGSNPAVVEYLRGYGIRPSLRDAGADAPTIEKVVSMVEQSGFNTGPNAIPYGT